ncbi:NEDD4-binding protein 2 [Bienertia sinuspersici]
MESNRQLKASWVAQQFLEVFKSRPHWPVKEIMDTVRLAYKVIVKKNWAYKVKYLEHRKLHGSMKEHYHKLGRYIEALRSSSPERVKRGWVEGCKRVLCVDGCFLKTFLGGQLLAAAVVEGETNASWACFFAELRKVLDDTDGTNMTLISDEAQAIINGVASVFPKAEHRHCARHVFAH